MSNNFGFTVFVFVIAFMNVAGAAFSIRRAFARARLKSVIYPDTSLNFKLGNVVTFLTVFIKIKGPYFALFLCIVFYIVAFISYIMRTNNTWQFGSVVTVVTIVFLFIVYVDLFIIFTRRFSPLSSKRTHFLIGMTKRLLFQFYKNIKNSRRDDE